LPSKAPHIPFVVSRQAISWGLTRLGGKPHPPPAWLPGRILSRFPSRTDWVPKAAFGWHHQPQPKVPKAGRTRNPSSSLSWKLKAESGLDEPL